MTARHPLIEVISDDLENSSSELLEPTPVTTTCHIDSRTTSSSGGSNSHAAASVASSLRFPAPLVRSCDLATDSEWANARTDLSVCLEQLDAQLSSSSNSPCQANCSSVQPIQLVSRSVAEALFLIHSAIVPQLEPVVRAETPEAFQWTNAQLADTAARLEAHLLKAVRVESLDALFASGCEEDAPNRYLCALPALVRTQLSLPEPHTNATPSKAPDSSTLREPLRTERERSDRVPAWSYRPWLLVSLASLLSHVRFPSLRGAVLELALGTALNLLEVRSPSRLLGIQLARHALAECARAELRATGLAHALYAALTPLTFQTGDEPQQLALIRGLHAALIDTIRVLDPLPVLPPADLQLRVAAVLRECAGREQRARVDALLAFVDSELLRAADSTSEGSSGGGGGRTGRTPNVPDPRDPSSSCLTRFEYCVDRVLYLLRMEVKSSTCEALADALLGYVLAASPAAVTANRVPLADASCTFSVAGRRAIHPPSRPIGSIVPFAEPLLHTLELCLEHHSGSLCLVCRLLDCVDAFVRSGAAAASSALTRVFGLLCRVAMRAEPTLYSTQSRREFAAGAAAGSDCASGTGLESRLRASFETLFSIEANEAAGETGATVVEPLVRALRSDAELALEHNYPMLYRCLKLPDPQDS